MNLCRATILSLALAGCGGAGPSANSADDAEWSASALRKLDPELRAQVRENQSGRFAISVLFVELPPDDELEALALNRLGERVVGNVEQETLLVIAAREDVERIEALDDVGYDMM
jgi:hypothetical protein